MCHSASSTEGADHALPAAAHLASLRGVQDAKKGILFEEFPPVLQLQLKRFEYDFMKDAMVKVGGGGSVLDHRPWPPTVWV